LAQLEGLYRVNEAALALLKGGAEMAVQDGANIGSLMQNGRIIGQARFLPVSMTAATAIAAIGPAIAMIGLQMQLTELTRLTRSTLEITRILLKLERNKQWTEF